MAVERVAEAAGMAYREAGESAAPAVLLVHGYPESSYMWSHAMAAMTEAGWRAIAPDLPGYGDSEPPDGPATWESHVESLERFRVALDLNGVVLVTHDWGVLIGLRWACDNPGAARALVISDGGFFADRRWHDVANTMRTEGEGERLMEGFTRDGFEALMKQVSSGMAADAVEHYWRGFDGDRRRRGHLEMYRSGDFEKLEPYEGCVAALGVPTLVLWGAQDRFSGVKMAHRFHAEIPGSELHVLDDAGHFIWEDEPDVTARALVDFLERRVPRRAP
jgi:pimeloyl-ACP methyl ester carboxylesterase